MSSAFETAKIAAAQGLRCFPGSAIWAAGADGLATTDLATLAKIDSLDPRAMWLAALPDSGIVCLSTPRARDYDILAGQLGEIPTTMSVSRGDQNESVVRWLRAPLSANLKIREMFSGTRAMFKKNGVLPESINVHTGEVYYIVEGGEFDLRRCAELPQKWIDAAPRNSGPGITATVNARHEWQPQIREEDFARRSYRSFND
ncbi:MAG: bifunctional DNA primase/polymerase [Rhizomicrobium sp.]